LPLKQQLQLLRVSQSLDSNSLPLLVANELGSPPLCFGCD